jgi:adenosyl cobinamide kinase/adenosyl cobinamide phosphate guanylyltransferase
MAVPTTASHDETGPDRFVFLVGGARSGKSDLAVELAAASGAPVTFVATATASDDDLVDRIRRHREERPAGWATVEAPLEVGAAVSSVADDATVVIDCLTLWLSNAMAAGRQEPAIVAEAAELARQLAARSGWSIVVSNEVGLGVHPPTELGRRYRDALGRVNRQVAAMAGRSLLLVAGRGLELRDPLRLVMGET